MSPNYDLACFCAQQCAEKYLKAVLREKRRPIPKIHDLAVLIEMLKPLYPELVLLSPFAESLSSCAVMFRYPGTEATKENAMPSYLDCSEVRGASRRILGLPGNGGRKRRARS